MLAYDLFFQNKSSSSAVTNVKRVKPIKKIYYFEKGNVRLDDKTREEYGSEILFKTQDILSMPLNTSPYLSLPNKVTGSNQPRPYVELYGRMEAKKSGDTVFSISRTGKNNKRKRITFSATYNTGTKQQTTISSATTAGRNNNNNNNTSAAIFLNLDKKHYFIEDKNLFQLYMDSGALSPNCSLSVGVFKTICNLFFDYVKERWTNDEDNNINSMNERAMDFLLFVLPSDLPVEYREEGSLSEPQGKQSSESSSSSTYSDQTDKKEEEIDAFGSSFLNLPNKPTQTAKFMSFDDPAFTINFAEKERFYKNLFIGLESHEKSLFLQTM